MSTSIAITGMGVVTSLGLSVDELHRSLVAGRCGAREVPRFAAEGLRHHHAALVEREPVWSALGLAVDSLPWASAMALLAARRALADAGLPTTLAPGPGAGPTLDGHANPVTPVACSPPLVLACSIGAPGALERQGKSWTELDPTDPETLARYSQGAIVAFVARALGATGRVACLTTTCASGNYAVGLGMDLLREGEADLALVGGVEELSTMPYTAFHQLRALAATCRPFDARRSGLLFGEGAGVLVLERADHARARGAHIHAFPLAVGYSNDAHHLVAPHPEGEGAARAIRACLAAAGLGADDVDFVNAHGTGTDLNDAGEAKALATVLGPRASTIPLHSVKGAIGHTMAAASALEAVIVADALERQELAPTVGLEEPDPALGMRAVHGAPVSLAGERAGAGADVGISDAFGFGGNNAVLAVSRSERRVLNSPRRSAYVAGAAAWVGAVSGFDAVRARLAAGGALSSEEHHAAFDAAALLGKKGLRHVDRGAQLVAAALSVDSGAKPQGQAARVGAVIGSAFPAYGSVIEMLHQFRAGGAASVNPMLVPFATSNCAPSWWLLREGLQGFNGNVGSGECAGLDAIVLGARQLAWDRADELLAGGVEGATPELWRGLERIGGYETSFTEAMAGVRLTTSKEGAWARVVAEEARFDAQDPVGASRRVASALAARVQVARFDLVCSPRPIAGLSADVALELSAVLGELLGAGGALALALAADRCRALDVAARVLVLSWSREGYATGVVLAPVAVAG